MQSQINLATIAAFNQARYVFTGEGIEGTLAIGHRCSDAVRLMQKSGVQSAAFITAYNPLSNIQPDTSNLKSAYSLRSDLVKLTDKIYPAAASSPDGEWPSELGFLVLGVDRPTIEGLGRKYSQDAIVCVHADGLAELVLLR